MEFRQATSADRKAVEWLWSYCFEPAQDPFFQYYFKNVYSPEDTLVAYDKDPVTGDEYLAANVHLRPYTVSVRNKAFPMAYIVGVATHPIARSTGVGKQLLRASLEELRLRGHGLSILMPSKAAFYQPYGWELYCHQWKRELPLEELRPLTSRQGQCHWITSPDQWELLAPIYEAYTEGLSGYAVRSEIDWRRLLGSVLAEGGRILLVTEQQDATMQRGNSHSTEQKQEQEVGLEPEHSATGTGYMFFRLGEPTIFVSEMVYRTRSAQEILLAMIYNHRSQGTTVRWNEGLQDRGYVFYPDGQKGNEVMPFMMSRIVDVATALETVPVGASAEGSKEQLEGQSILWHVTDPLCPWNEGFFRATYGPEGVQVEPIAAGAEGAGEARADASADTGDSLTVHIGVGDLGLLLMGRLSAKDLAFEGKIETTPQGIDLLETFYPTWATYINEWY